MLRLDNEGTVETHGSSLTTASQGAKYPKHFDSNCLNGGS